MKKLLALALAVLMIAALPTAAFATSPATNTGVAPTDITVTGTYVAGTSSDTIISVAISWDEMSFTYNGGSEGTWNPVTHQYEGGTAEGWDSTAKNITVTNHSNGGIKASFAFNKAAAAPADMRGSFASTDSYWDSNENFVLIASAVDTDVSEAPNAIVSFSIAGGAIEGDATLGTISVTIARSYDSLQG